MLEEILGDDFVPIDKVYREMAKHGMKKFEVKKEKKLLGARTVEVEKDGKRMWLWFLPERIWEKYHE